MHAMKPLECVIRGHLSSHRQFSLLLRRGGAVAVTGGDSARGNGWTMSKRRLIRQQYDSCTQQVSGKEDDGSASNSNEDLPTGK